MATDDMYKSLRDMAEIALAAHMRSDRLTKNPCAAFIDALNEVCPPLQYNAHFGTRGGMQWPDNAVEAASIVVRQSSVPIETINFLAALHLKG